MNPRITNWRGRRVWLVGAALARELAGRGARLEVWGGVDLVVYLAGDYAPARRFTGV